MKDRLGVVLWRGPSVIDGSPIAVVATGLKRRSKNVKTGDMIQYWIIRSDINPIAARQSGADVSICGDCPLRDGRCYVRVERAPNQVYRTLVACGYEEYDPKAHDRYILGRKGRFGAYGDPAAAPIRIWQRQAVLLDGRTGYTHQWHWCDRRFAKLVMASCENEEEVAMARARGYHTFRVRLRGQRKRPDEIVCPASAEAGKKRTCETCLACHGAGHGKSVVIVAHGKRFPLKLA